MEENKMERISEIDLLKLKIVSLNKRIILLEAEKAISKNETSQLEYDKYVRNLYDQYNLSDKDTIDNEGKIIRNYQEVGQK